MAVNDEHEDYEKYSKQWSKLRDCISGQDAVHDKGDTYLPKLSGQSTSEYNAYKARGLFYGATSRTVEGLSGMVFRKKPQIDNPTALDGILSDITLTGVNITGFAEQIIDDDISVGRAGILVDHPTTNGDVTIVQAEQLNLRPFLKHYTAEQIFNWRTESRNNVQVVVEVRLREFVEVATDKEFETTTQEQIRVLDFNDENQYRQRVFVKKGGVNSAWEPSGDDIIPLMKGAPLTIIPFFFVGVKNGEIGIEKPPLIDLANVNLSHYMSTADIEHGAHFTALPTAVIAGHTDDPANPSTFRIGAANAWVFTNIDTKVEYLEFQGQGLEALEKRIEKKEGYMAALGARMLAPEKRAVETAETANINRAGETSVLASLAISVSMTIQDALTFLAEWAGVSGEIKFRLNTDFLVVTMSSQDLTALLQTWQSGGIAYADFLNNLKRGEIVQEDRTEDEIKSEIETENPFNNEDMDND